MGRRTTGRRTTGRPTTGRRMRYLVDIDCEHTHIEVSTERKEGRKESHIEREREREYVVFSSSLSCPYQYSSLLFYVYSSSSHFTDSPLHNCHEDKREDQQLHFGKEEGFVDCI